jgi:spermidine/putrescine transport system permease protein
LVCATSHAERAPGSLADRVLGVYLVCFLIYLFLPLALMAAAAFNRFPQPALLPWQGFTWHWFGVLAHDERLIAGLWHTLIVGLGVTAAAVPMGLAAALVLTRLQGRAGGLLYGLLVSPILTPGVILGISTLVFWRQFDVSGGLFVAGAAQTSFIASYCMLIIMARLQRQDRSLEEAALDLGASPWLLFRRVTLPFLTPALVSAGFVAFLQSIENYNTTVFAIGGESTLVTEIGSRLRFGLSPAVNVIGVIFLAVTVLAASAFVLLRSRRR